MPEHQRRFRRTCATSAARAVTKDGEPARMFDANGQDSDPNWQLTTGWRARFGRVLLFDPTNPDSSAYNPLIEVRRGDSEVRDVQNVADILVDPEGALERRYHWEKTSHSLLVARSSTCSPPNPIRHWRALPTSFPTPSGRSRRRQAMMRTPHLLDHPHPVVTSAARELLNKSQNERSGLLSTAMSFLGLYRDPIIAKVTNRCDWRTADLVQGNRPATLYLVVPPSDISRTKPMVRLVLNQIGRRLTEQVRSSPWTDIVPAASYRCADHPCRGPVPQAK
jgi:type IV secretion system protein VirD4